MSFLRQTTSSPVPSKMSRQSSAPFAKVVKLGAGCSLMRMALVAMLVQPPIPVASSETKYVPSSVYLYERCIWLSRPLGEGAPNFLFKAVTVVDVTSVARDPSHPRVVFVN